MTYSFNPFTGNFDLTNLTSPAIYNNNGMTTLRERMTRLATNAQKVGNIWTKPWMKTLQIWQPLTVYVARDIIVNNGLMFVCATGGTSASFGGPTSVIPGGTTDGTVLWIYWGENKVSTDPYVSQPAWTQSSTPALGTQTIANGNVYFVVAITVYVFTVSGVTVTPTSGAVYTNNAKSFYVAATSIAAGSGTISCIGTGAPTASGTLTKSSGTGDATISFASVVTNTGTASSGTGPSGTGNAIVDKGIAWSYFATLAANPYAGYIPAVSYAASNPSSPINNVYGSTNNNKFTCIFASPLGTGTGYAVNDTITISVGNGSKTTDIVLTVLTVNAGVPQTLSITNPGLYTNLQSNNAFWSQGSTSGAGTGETFTLGFSGPTWAVCNGIMPAYKTNSFWGSGMTFIAANTAAKTVQHWSMEFWTDADLVVLAQGVAASTNISIDGIMYSPGINSGVLSGNSYATFDFTNAGGVKPRLFKISGTTQTFVPGVIINQKYTVWKPEDKDRITCAYINDSLDAGSNYGPLVGGNSVANRLSEELGWRNVWALTQGGTGYVNQGASPGVTTNNYGYRVAQGLALNPDIWIFMGSSNDFTSSTSTVTSTVTTTLQSIRDGGSTAPIVVFGIWSYNNANVPTYEAAVQAGVTAFSDPYNRTFFIPIYNDPNLFPWIQGTWNNNPAPSGISNSSALNANSYIGGDNLHPPDLGTMYLAVRKAQAIIENVIPYINT